MYTNLGFGSWAKALTARSGRVPTRQRLGPWGTFEGWITSGVLPAFRGARLPKDFSCTKEPNSLANTLTFSWGHEGSKRDIADESFHAIRDGTLPKPTIPYSP